MALHCPATLLLASTPHDEGGVRALVDRLGDERILAVVSAPGEARAAEVAELLDVPLETDADLAEAPDRHTLLGVADLHRGETVVILTPGAGGGAPAVARIEIGDC